MNLQSMVVHFLDTFGQIPILILQFVAFCQAFFADCFYTYKN